MTLLSSRRMVEFLIPDALEVSGNLAATLPTKSASFNPKNSPVTKNLPK
jgi:hypothetical protein